MARTLSLALGLVAVAPVAAQTTFGTSCVDSAGGFPSISYPASAFIQNPSVDENISLFGAIPGSSAVLFVGDAPSVNIDLSIIGATGCFLYVNPFAQIAVTADPAGAANVALGAIPFGSDFVFQWAVIDPAAPRPLAIVTSDAVEAGVPTQERVFRINDLDLRDPHITLPFLFACVDLTDSAFGLLPGLNSLLENAITTDGDGDNLLDVSSMLIFRPDATGTSGLLDFTTGDCTAPLATTQCSIPDTPPGFRAEYTAGCVTAIPNTLRPYSPPVSFPTGACFATNSTTINFALAGVQLPLADLQLGGQFVGNPPTAITNGVMRGFLPEALADAIVFPATSPIAAGQSLSSLLPGGTGNCSTGSDDRDLAPDGVTRGWYFYFNFEAVAVPVN